MARIAGVNIPQNKLVQVGLTYIYGIGDKFSNEICKALEIPKSKRVNELSEDEVLKVPDIFNPRLSYGGSKIIGELLTVNYFRNSSTKYKILRPHNVYGPDMGNDHVLPELITKIKKQKTKNKIQLEIFGSGEESRSFIYIDDFISGFDKVFKKGKNF